MLIRKIVAFVLLLVQFLLPPLSFANSVVRNDDAHKPMVDLGDSYEQTQIGASDVMFHDGALTELSTRLVGTETDEETQEAVRSYLGGKAQGFLNTSAENWLSQYGTAEVNVSLDSDFSGNSRYR